MKNRKILKYISLLVSLMVAACAPNVLADKDKENANIKNEESGSTSTQNRKQTEVLEEQNLKQQTKEKKPENKKNKDQKRKKKGKKEETEIKKEEKKEVEIKKGKEEKEDAKDLTKKKEKNLEKEPEKKDLKEKNETKSKGEREPKEREKKEEKVKEFNKKDYEVDGFNLEVIEKNGCHILNYTNKTMNSPCCFLLHDNSSDLKGYTNTIVFRVPVVDGSGVNHMCEHLAYPMRANRDVNVLQKNGLNSEKEWQFRTFQSCMNFRVLSDRCIPEIFDEFLKEFTMKNVFFNEESFKREVCGVTKIDGEKFNCGGVYYEKIKDEINSLGRDSSDEKNSRFFSSMGTLKDIKKATLDDVKKVKEKFFHPSNAVFYINCVKDPKIVKRYLKSYESWCSNYEGPKKYDLKELAPKFKNNDEFLEHEEYDDSHYFRYFDPKVSKSKTTKYRANVMILLNPELNAHQSDVFRFFKNEFPKIVGKDVLEKMGYKSCEFYDYVNLNPLLLANALSLQGDNKESFSREKLKENAEKIMNIFVDKVKKLSKPKLYKLYFPVDEKTGKEKVDYSCFNELNNYRLNESTGDLILKSFLYTGKPFSKKFFDIEGGKILDDKHRFLENINKNLNSLDWLYKAFSKPGFVYFDIYSNNGLNEKKEYCKKHNINFEKGFNSIGEFYINYKLPIKDKFLFEFFVELFHRRFIEKNVNQRGYCYLGFRSPVGYGLPFETYAVGEQKDIFKKYFTSEQFKKDLKNFKISEEDFKLEKEFFKKRVEKWKESFDKVFNSFENENKKYKDNVDSLKKADAEKFSDEVYKLYDFIFYNEKYFKDKKQMLKFYKFYFSFWKNYIDEFDKNMNNERLTEREKEKYLKKYRKVLKKHYKFIYDLFKDYRKRVDKLIENCDGVIKDLSVEEFLKKMKSIKITGFKEGVYRYLI